MQSVPKRGPFDFPALLIVLLLLVNSLFIYWQNSSRSQKIDFFTLWAVPQALATGVATSIYSPEGQKELASELERRAALPETAEIQKQVTGRVTALYSGRIDATATPFLYAVTGLLSSGDYERDRFVFITGSAICLLCSIVILCRLLNLTPIASVAAAAFFNSFYLPLLSDLQAGNINQILLFIITLYLVSGKSAAPGRIVLSGMILSAGILLKPVIVMVLVFGVIQLAIHRNVKKLFYLLLGCGFGAAVCLLLSCAFFGTFTVWVEFVKSLPGTLGFSYPLSHGNYSLPALLFLLTGRNYSIALLLLVTAIFVLICLPKQSGARTVQQAELFYSTGMGCAALPLASGLAWLHYYVLMIPLILLVMAPAEKPDGSGRSGLLMQIAAGLSLFLFTPVGGIITGISPVSLCITFNSATAMLVLLLFAKVRRSGKCSEMEQTDL